jgi:alkylhydroperoxidase family enzyme
VDIRHAVGVKVGLPESKLAALARYRESAEFERREVAALEFAEEMVRGDREVSDACWARVREHFSEPEAVELAFIVGYQTFASQFAKAFALAPQGLAARAVARPPAAAPAEAPAGG